MTIMQKNLDALKIDMRMSSVVCIFLIHIRYLWLLQDNIDYYIKKAIWLLDNKKK